MWKNQKGESWFDLACPGPDEPPYVMAEGIEPFFKLIWQNAHLYRVEEDYTLVLVAPSLEALQWGIEAPERVRPDENLLEKLRTVIKYI
jgi:hypothetical protein